MSKTVCESCSNEYKRLAGHWSCSSSCSHPPLSDEQIEIATGLLMGDGCLNRNNKNPYLVSEMISPNYLKYIDNKFGLFGNGVSFLRSAEESAKRAVVSGFRTDAKAKNYSELYKWQSMSHPDLLQLSGWYATGEKVWPEDIELTPTVLKHWYCCDGSYNNNGSSNHIKISMGNENGNTDKIDRMFKNVGLPSPEQYQSGDNNAFDAVFTVNQSHKIWNYMEEPLPDFEYKWHNEYQ